MSFQEKFKANKKINYFFVIQWILLSAIIFYLSHQNTLDFIPKSILTYDKILHFLAYFVYGLSTLSMLICIKKKDKGLVVSGFILSLFFAISDEIHQFFVPNRMMDIGDLIADLLGIFFSVIFFNLILKNLLLSIIKIGKTKD